MIWHDNIFQEIHHRITICTAERVKIEMKVVELISFKQVRVHHDLILSLIECFLESSIRTNQIESYYRAAKIILLQALIVLKHCKT